MTAADHTGSRSAKAANKRGAARLGAVQALYQMDVGGTELPSVLDEFEANRLGSEVDGETYRSADADYFRSIVSGVVRDQRELDPRIHGALTDDWPLARIDATLRAVLRCGTFELTQRHDVPTAVIINEYVDIARAFFDDDETRLVNGVLDTIARQVRADASQSG